MNLVVVDVKLFGGNEGGQTFVDSVRQFGEHKQPSLSDEYQKEIESVIYCCIWK